MKQYDVIIIGSGVGGLTCGAFLAKHGKKVLILEQHHKPGGAVTSFSREGFLFDVPSAVCSMHPKFSYGRILSELGIFNKLDFIKLEKLFHFIYPDLIVDCYANTDRYHTELESLFPAERSGLDRYFTLMQSIMKEVRNAYYAPGLLQTLQYPFRFPLVMRYKGVRFKDLLDNMFKDDRLKTILAGGWEYLGVCPERLSALYMMIMYQSYIGEGAYAPRGGFQKMADAFADAYRGYGGELRLASLVKQIKVDAGRATGIVLDHDEEIAGRAIVSNADVKRTFFDLIGKDRLPRRLFRHLAKMEMSGSGLSIQLGVRMNIPETFNCGTVFYHPSWKTAGSHWDAYLDHEMVTDLKSKNFAFEVRSLADPSHAPEGCHTVRIWNFPVSSRYRNNWMQHDRHAYRDLKDRMLDNLVLAAEQVIPGLSKNILVSDVSTPRTYERFLLSTNGAWYDAACTPRQIGLSRMPSKTIIPGLYLTGAKSFPGHGIVSAIECGLCTADILLEKRIVGGRYSFKN